ncbi:MAG: PD-(D/E)XK nuclease family protein, partial [Oscillospiraceae bacterium]|nr:PD-(D/E)XK nuclease family protein [Oscillospiraceae bacterium]
RRREPERFAALEAAASLKRGRLSPRAAEALYGSRPRLSASKADSLAACRFRYFCQYGLQAQPYEPAGFTPPEVGAFIHTVLERTLREVKNRGGFGAVSDEALRALARQVSETYIHEELDDFQEKSPRFEHLFRRLIRDAELIVLDAVQELRRSDFEPLDFELNFSKAVTKSPLRLGAVRLSGVADRVDGWVRGDKLYLRVVDYKTGVKKFSLSDVWYGLGMQMLLYLFALQENGEEIYGRPVEAAGIMYLPARSALLSLDRDDGEALERERADALRRSGLVLDDAALIEAWERGEDKRYIPIRFNRGRPGSGLASAEQLGKLRRHVQKTLGDMAEALREGRIEAEPYYRTANDNACSNCDFADACQFSDGENGERCRVLSKLKNEEVWEKIDREVGENG